MGTRVLVVAAHPDDEVLGMGGTIALHARVRGDAVRILCLTDGSSAQYPGDAARRERKNREARAAARILGVEDYVHLDLPDMRLDDVEHVQVNGAIETHVRAFEPEVVYTVHPDVNRDHVATFASAMVAVRPLPGSTVRRVLSYAPLSSGEWTPPTEDTFRPNWFVDVSGTLRWKLEAFAAYRTERRPFPHPRSARALRARAASWGSACGHAAAEPFVLVRGIEGGPA